jgi:hypothetical protein
VDWLALCPSDRQAGNGDRLAPTRISAVLELEKSPSTGPAFDLARTHRSNPQDEFGQSSSGRCPSPKLGTHLKRRICGKARNIVTRLEIYSLARFRRSARVIEIQLAQRLDVRYFGTTSGHLGSGNFVDFPCKRHQRSCLVFSPTCFASRGSPVRSRPRPPSFPFGFIELTAVASLAILNRAPSSRRSTMWANLPISIRIHGSVKLYNKFPFSTDDRKLVS